MATYYDRITDEQAELIRAAPLFFVATADSKLANGPRGVGPVNLSPKGATPLHIIDPNRVAYLDYTGSGNETARHSESGGPITLLVCSFEAENAAIVRLFGQASVAPIGESSVAKVVEGSTADQLALPERQVIEVSVRSTMTSCGYGVPVMEVVRQRQTVDRGRRYKARG